MFIRDDHRDAPPGFGLRITASGAAAFYVVKRALGRKVWIRCADATLDLDEARKTGHAKAGDLARDRDVNREAREAREQARAARSEALRAATAPTVAELVLRYVETREAVLAPTTAHEYRRTVERDFEPSRFGRMKAEAVVQEDVRGFVKLLARAGKHQADRALALLRSAYKWAMREEVERGVKLAASDPTAGVERPTLKHERERRRTLVNVKAATEDEAFAELRKFWLGVESMKPVPRAYVRLLLLLGLRRAEAAKATWGEIRLEGAGPTWHVPAEGRKVRRSTLDPDSDSLDVPLAPLAVRILEELREQTGGRGDAFPRLHFGLVAAAMRRASGIPDIALHDLRRSCTTGLLRIGAPPHVLTDVLGHRQRGLADSDAVYLQGRRVAEYRDWLARWADTIEALVYEGARKARVAPFRKRTPWHSRRRRP